MRRQDHRALSRATTGALGLVTVGALVTSCDKPQPTVTMFNGSKARIVSAQPACLLTGKCGGDNRKVVVVAAAAGSRILIDVPRELARAGWIVAAFTTDASGKNTAIEGAGSTSVRGDHTVRVQVPQASSGGYFLQVSALRPSNQLTTWVARVQLTQ